MAKQAATSSSKLERTKRKDQAFILNLNLLNLNNLKLFEKKRLEVKVKK
jgi:hypothetical protein